MNNGQVILISGSSSGIGLHLAKHYLERGWTVAGCARHAAPLAHDRYVHFCVDVADSASVEKMFAGIRTQFGALHAIVNNAGVASMNAIALTPAAAARQVLETNVLGTFLITHAGLRLLRRGKSGRIVNVTTIAVPARLAGEAIYAASKSAVETFTRIAAKEFGPFGITCNTVGPSPVRTRLTNSVPITKLQALVEQQAVQRWAEPEDVANVVDFFLSDRSSLVTGQVVYLGGYG
jgi:3-oxoacyl-[acyl-carrier protein] reductase